MRYILAALVVAFVPAAFCQSAAVASLEQATRQRPGDAALWFYLARAQALAGDKRTAVASLEKAGELGDGFLPPRDGFEALWDDGDFQRVRAKMEARLPRLDSAPIAAQLEDRTLIPEGIAYDVPSHTLFMGSIAQRKVLRIADSGTVSEFASGSDLDAILGVAVDSPRRILYVVSTSALTDAGRARPRNAVLAFDVDTRRFLQRYDVPAAAQLNDVTVAPGGRAFASDSSAGAIYELPVKGPGPARALVPAGQLPGSNGLAASPDGRRLYVAHSTGISVVDIASGEARKLANDTRESVAAIDGLYEWQGQLIGVQNVTTPGRVVLVSLSHEGDRIVKVQTLLSHHHNQLDEPTTGAVTDHGFYLLAATGVAHFNAKGQIDKPETLPHPTVVRIALPR
jgi:sugar lactone lactonase YvrE